jgi:hypothetical protein
MQLGYGSIVLLRLMALGTRSCKNDLRLAWHATVVAICLTQTNETNQRPRTLLQNAKIKHGAGIIEKQYSRRYGA